MYYLQTADLNISFEKAKELKNKIIKICHCYVMLKDENGREI